MKQTIFSAGMLALTLTLAACGSDDKTTIVHDRPIVVNSPAATSTPSSVESDCKHGYDNSTHSCY